MSTVAVGCELSGYRLDALIGRGGMGVVYRGVDLRLDRPVAIKLIAAERATDPVVRRRFEREARLMAALDHPNVLPVYAAGEQDGSLFLVMRYVEGIDLAALLRAEGRLSPARAARITDQLAQALDAAHAAGLVHRDVKPANVLLAGDHVYLSDFGLGRAVRGATRLTDTGEWLGTVDFCSPEQLRGEATDARSDVYALGCVLHTALTGEPPFHRATAEATMLAHLNDPPPAASAILDVPRTFDAALERALAKRPTDRYATAGELGRAACAAAQASRQVRTSRPARRAVKGGPAPTKLDLRPPRGDVAAAGPASRRRIKPRVLAAAAALLAAAAAAMVALVLAAGSPPPPRGPLRAGEITGAVRAFAAAYDQRNSHALARILAPQVMELTPGAAERGRAAVLTDLKAQFGATTGYALGDVAVQPGWVGRATSQYAVLRTGRPDLSGQITFGIERVAGRPVIGLIVIQPAG